MSLPHALPDHSAGPRHPEKAHRPDQPVARKPAWIRVKAPGSAQWAETQRIVKGHGLVTVCEEAACPNIGACWEKRHATFMVMGDTCTRACAFCNVKTGLPRALDPSEPARVAEAIHKLGLAHAVITSVDRDDLSDGGAEHFAEVVAAIHRLSPKTTIEVLTPDFLRKPGALEKVVAARPDVFNHNLETVASKYLKVRPGARYFHSIRLLQRVKEIDADMFVTQERECRGGHYLFGVLLCLSMPPGRGYSCNRRTDAADRGDRSRRKHRECASSRRRRGRER